jgi:hypothetical protein
MISRTGRGGSTVSTRIRHLLISLGCILVLTTGCLPVPPPPRPTPAPDGTTSSASPSPYSPADSQLDLTADWNGVGAAQVGDTAAEAGHKLGLVFPAADWHYRGGTQCAVVLDTTHRIGLILSGTDSTVQAFIVGTPEIPFVADHGAIIVGDELDNVYALYTHSYDVMDTGMSSRTGGSQVIVQPAQYNPPDAPFDRDNVGRSAKFGADPQGRISEYHVGAYTAVHDAHDCYI